MTKLVKIIGINLLLSIVVISVGISNSNASGFNSLLKGEYVFSTTKSCAVGPIGDGFNENLSRIADGSSYTMFIQGVYTFNGEGTGSFTFTSLTIQHNQFLAGQFPVRQFYGSGTLLYNVYDDKAFTVESQATVNWSHNGIDHTGIRSGTEVDGWIGLGNQLIIGSDTQPNIEINTFENGTTQELICGRNGTTMRKKMTE